jgi:hypothetical protein
MARFNPDEYTTVAERIDRFWAKFPDGRILTQLIHFNEDQCVVRAEVFLDREDVVPVTSDYAEERLNGSPVNKTSMVENCATSAIGRALADLGGEFTGKKRASREEMEKVQRLKETKTVDIPEHFWADLAAVSSFDELTALWESTIAEGFSQSVVKDFSKRKEELGG